MTIKPGFELRDVCGEKVVIAQGLENIDFSHLITLSESAAYLFAAIGNEPFTEETLTDLLLKEYEVDRSTAAADVKALVASWRELGILTD